MFISYQRVLGNMLQEFYFIFQHTAEAAVGKMNKGKIGGRKVDLFFL